MSGEKMTGFSVSPAGERFPIPSGEEYEKEYQKVKALAETAKNESKEIVVVMGVGFVGAVMAAIIANTRDEKGNYTKFVIGCQRPSERSYWKIPLLAANLPLKQRIPKLIN